MKEMAKTIKLLEAKSFCYEQIFVLGSWRQSIIKIDTERAKSKR